MAISKLELMRLSDTYDGEFDFADFSEEELREILDADELPSREELRERYFAEHDDIKDRTLAHHRWAD